MNIAKITIISALVLTTTAGCTAKERARSFGGKDTVELACNQKLFNVTWKESTLWTATRPMREGESAEKYDFQADSAYGIWEGTVVISEKICPNKG